MGKNARQLLILLIVLAVLAGTFLGLRRYNEAQSAKEEEDVREVVASVNKDEIVSFTFDYNNVTYTFEKEDEIWYYAEDKTLPILQDDIEEMLSQVAPLYAEMKIEGVTDMEQYGFQRPDKVIRYETAEETYEFEVGSYNSVSGIYYLRRASEDTVYVVPPLTVTSFDRTLEGLTQQPESTEESSETAESTEESSDGIGSAEESLE